MGLIFLLVLFLLMALFATSVYISFRKRNAALKDNQYVE